MFVFDYDKYVAFKNERGLTDYRVANDTDITASTFTDWKNGRSKPKIDKILKIANFYNVPVETFVSNVSESEEANICV